VPDSRSPAGSRERVRTTMVPLILWLALAFAEQVVPVASEPRHHVVYQNDWVRVIDAFFPAGDTTLYHTHDRDNVPICLAGGAMTTQPLGGPVQPGTARVGSVGFARSSYTHRIVNVGREDLHFLDVEILQPPDTDTPLGPESGIANHALEFENDRVRVFRVRGLADAESPAHSHPQRVLGVVVPSTDTSGPTQGHNALPPPSGSLTWYEPKQPVHTPAGVEVIEIEIK